MTAAPALITTVHSDQHELIDAVRTLHNDGRQIQCDLTYGSGGFWKGDDEEPSIRMELEPQWKLLPGSKTEEITHCNIQADARALPFCNNSIRSVAHDPPFIHAAGKDSLMGQRFGSYPSQRELHIMYWQAAREIQRCLVPGGLLLWKTQDIIESGRQIWTHVDVLQNCRALGLSPIDLFILVRDPKHAMVGWNHSVQQHARKVHSYFLVFRKETTKLERPTKTKKEPQDD